MILPQHIAVPMIGPLRVRVAGRHCDWSALVMGDQTLFGAVPMEMMDLALHPATQTLTINPADPFFRSRWRNNGAGFAPVLICGRAVASRRGSVKYLDRVLFKR